MSLLGRTTAGLGCASSDFRFQEATMTTATPTVRSTMPWAYAVGGAAVSLALTAYGTFKEELQPGDVPGWLFINVPIILVATALVFGLAVAPVLRSEDADTPTHAALILALVGLGTIAVANFGLPAVFAAAALCTATASRRRAGGWTAATGVAVVLSALAVAAAVALAIVG
jgi:hypothetical protein